MNLFRMETLRTFGPPPVYDVILVGMEGVGKTSIYKRLHNNTFVEGRGSSKGDESFEREYMLPNQQTVSYRLYDTCGAERYEAVTRSYYQTAKLVVCVFSLDQHESLSQAKFYVHRAFKDSPKDALFTFVCNKIDLESGSGRENVQFEEDDIKEFLRQMKKDLEDNKRAPMSYHRTSAKTGQGIREALAFALTKTYEHQQEREQLKQSSGEAVLRKRTTAYEDDKTISLKDDDKRTEPTAESAQGRSCWCW